MPTGQIATRSHVANSFWGGGVFTQFNSRTTHRSTDTITALQVIFANWYAAPAESGTGLSTITITASVEYPAGTFTQIKFSASASGSITVGSQLLSDAVNVSIPNNTLFWIRSYQTSSTGQVINDTVNASLGDIYEKAASGLADKTLGGTITSDGSGHVNFPVAIIGTTSQPSVAIIGDSRPYGFTTNPVDGDRGDIAPAVGAANQGYINMGINSAKAQDFITAHTNQLALAAYCSDVVLEYGINDLAAGRTDAQLRADLNTILGYFSQPVFLTTMEPVSTSSSDWSTLPAQTTATYNADRVGNNNWRRTTPSGFTGYFEIADVVESARNSGLWKVSGGPLTVDGVHLFPATSENVVESSGAINTALFHWPPTVTATTSAFEVNADSSNFAIFVTQLKPAANAAISLKEFGIGGSVLP